MKQNEINIEEVLRNLQEELSEEGRRMPCKYMRQKSDRREYEYLEEKYGARGEYESLDDMYKTQVQNTKRWAEEDATLRDRGAQLGKAIRYAGLISWILSDTKRSDAEKGIIERAYHMHISQIYNQAYDASAVNYPERRSYKREEWSGYWD
ncbi:MAG: hypothetical protein V1743_01115 [Nanoarchaeota archaeon]